MRDDRSPTWDLGASGWLAVMVAVAAVALALLVKVAGLPLVLVAPMAAFFAALGALHWLLAVRAPERPLGFWAAYAIDWVLGGWLLLLLVTAFRHGGWESLAGLAGRLGQDQALARARPDAVVVAIAAAFVALQAVRLGEDSPWGAWLEARISPTWLHLGIKLALLIGLVAFLESGGEAMIRGWFPAR